MSDERAELQPIIARVVFAQYVQRSADVQEHLAEDRVAQSISATGDAVSQAGSCPVRGVFDDFDEFLHRGRLVIGENQSQPKRPARREMFLTNSLQSSQLPLLCAQQ